MNLTGGFLLRYFWIGLGILSLILGTAGIVLPLLPTVPFYLLTIFCFSKGSKRLHQWFLQTDLYKKHLADFVQHKTMDNFVKLKIICVVTCMLLAGYYFMPSEVYWGKYILLAVWIAHVVYLVFGVKSKK